MPRCHGRKPVLQRPCAEHTELDLAVAHDVGIRGEAAPVAVEEVLDDLLAVVPHEVDDLEPDPDLPGDAPGVLDVLHPGAMANRAVLVDPVLHVRPGNVAPLPLEKERGDRTVDAAGHGDEDSFRRLHGIPTTGRYTAPVNPTSGGWRFAGGVLKPRREGFLVRVGVQAAPPLGELAALDRNLPQEARVPELPAGVSGRGRRVLPR